MDIDSIQINFNLQQLFILNICLAFIMFGVALDLNFGHFKQVFQRPKVPVTGLVSQLIVLPILTLTLIFILHPPPSVALGMVLVAACPGGNVSNFAVHLAKGNTALSVILTTISTLGAIVITPFYFSVLSKFLPDMDKMDYVVAVNPMDMVFSIFQLVLVPLTIGMLFRHFLPGITKKIRVTVKGMSIIIFFGFIVAAVYGNFDNLRKYLHLVFLFVLIHNIVALTSGYWVAKLNKLSQVNARTISLETGIQNSGLALIIIFNFFDGLGGMALIAAWWGVWHLISAFSVSTWWAKRPIRS